MDLESLFIHICVNLFFLLNFLFLSDQNYPLKLSYGVMFYLVVPRDALSGLFIVSPSSLNPGFPVLLLPDRSYLLVIDDKGLKCGGDFENVRLCKIKSLNIQWFPGESNVYMF